MDEETRLRHHIRGLSDRDLSAAIVEAEERRKVLERLTETLAAEAQRRYEQKENP